MRLAFFASLLYALAACSSRATAPAPPSNAAPPAAAAPAPEFTCGAAVCSPREICETRYKGHRSDDEGRPLERMKCMPLPDACTSTPTCSCVTAQVSATHCTDASSHVRIDDYPR